MPYRTRWWKALFVGSLVQALALVGVTLVVLDQRGAACERTVQVRDDNRAMWLWLVDQFPGDELASRAAAQLDLLLPPLRCDGTKPTPTEDP